jgi:hypothetical protein
MPASQTQPALVSFTTYVLLILGAVCADQVRTTTSFKFSLICVFDVYRSREVVHIYGWLPIRWLLFKTRS